MKNKKTFMVIGLIVAVLIMGIAYAGITSVDLLITGSASVVADQANFKVAFLEEAAVYTNNAPETVVASAEVTSDTTATISVEGLSKAGQYVEVEFTVENSSDILAADLSAVTNWSSADETQDWFNVVLDIGETPIEPGQETAVMVVIELLKTPVTDEDVANAAAEFDITITADPVQPAETGETV